jgi:AcrR family transcriptional regulator
VFDRHLRRYRTGWFGCFDRTSNQLVWQRDRLYARGVRSAGEATRERILEAAKEEFAERGLAGARINRIAAEAQASKERLYAYFPSKEGLFAAVVERLVVDVSDDTAAASGDMGAYVGSLFDNYVQNPVNARLHDWLNFETSGLTADSPEVLAFAPKLDDIRAGQAAGTVDASLDPAQLLVMLIEVTKSMAYPKPAARQLMKGNRRANTRASRRAAAVAAARRLSAPAAEADPQP